MAIMPTNIGSGRVVGRFIFGVVDGADANEEPDLIPAKGTITFAPSVPYMPDAADSNGPVTIVPATVTAVLDADGYVCTPDPEDATKAGYRGVRLFATDDTDLSVQNWTWTVTYRLAAIPGASAAIPAHSMTLPERSVKDLTTAVKVPSSPGVGVPQYEAAVLRAEGFADDSAQSAATALSVVDRADSGEFDGAPGNATMRVDTSVGTRVFITDGDTEHMVSGDTGWRRIAGWSDGAVTEGTIPARITPEGTTTGGIYLMRQNNQVTLAIVDGATDGTNPTIPLPAGFRGNNSQPYPAVPFSYRIGTDYFLSQAEVGATQVRLRLPTDARLSAAGSGGYGIMATWATAQAWPTSLPGTPA